MFKAINFYIKSVYNYYITESWAFDSGNELWLNAFRENNILMSAWSMKGEWQKAIVTCFPCLKWNEKRVERDWFWCNWGRNYIISMSSFSSSKFFSLRFLFVFCSFILLYSMVRHVMIHGTDFFSSIFLMIWSTCNPC